nr:transposase [Cryobacterium sp. 1639]
MRTLKRLRGVAEAELAKAAVTDSAEDAAKEPSAHDDLPPGMGPGSDRVGRIRALITESIEVSDAADGASARPERAPGGASRLSRAEAAIRDLEGVVEAGNAPRLKILQDRLRAAEEALARREARYATSKALYDANRAAKRVAGRAPIENSAKIVGARQSVDAASVRLARARHQEADQKAGEIDRTDRVILRRNLTDPQARLMQTRAGFIVGYNAQITVAEDQLILAVDATDHPNDLGQMIPQMQRLKSTIEYCRSQSERTDLEVGMVVVDNGYLSAENVDAPGFDRLIAPGRGTVKDGKWVGKIKGREGDTITAAAAHMIEKLALPGNQDRYKQRSGIVEPANAWIKDRRGLRQFSRRGLMAVNAELNLAAMTTNLLKLFVLTNQTAPATG